VFAIVAIDKPNSRELRAANRQAHLDYADASGVVFLGGPFLDGEGNMTGSLIILDVPDMSAAEAWAAGDPYAKAGLFETVTIRGWKKVRG
jgi:uncharacterized protein YciI